jgi:hypothetical protein
MTSAVRTRKDERFNEFHRLTTHTAKTSGKPASADGAVEW